MTIRTDKGMRGVRARYAAVLPPNISIVRHPGRPVISGMDFNHVHVQKRGFTKFLVFLKRVSLINPRVRANFVAFSLGRTGKSLEVRFDVGPQPGFSKQLFGSSREGTELDWKYFKQFLV